jgi:MFS family permease
MKCASPPPDRGGWDPPALLRALRHRNYRLFFGGQIISVTGTWMQSVAQGWLVYRLTGSAELLGFIGFASHIPLFLLAPLGGAVADRFSRHRVIVASQGAAMLQAAVLAALTLSGRVQVWHVAALAAFLGIVHAFDVPARQAFVIDMVGRDDLINAIALNSSIFNGARMIGPAVAGVLVAVIGEGWCFFVNAVSYGAVITGLLAMTRTARGHNARREAVLAETIAGFRFVARTAPVRSLLLLLGLVSLVGMPYLVLMPIFADDVLHGGARGLGLLVGATGAGAFTAALTMAARRGVRGLGRWVALAAAGFAVSLLLFSLSRSFPLSVALLLPTGFCMMVQMASSNTLVQAMVPDELRGRVMAVYSMMILGMAPFGALLAGALAQRLGAPTTVALGAVVSLGGAFLFALRLPAWRREARRVMAAAAR